MEKIDFVITWVDGSDPKWQEKKNAYKKPIKDDPWATKENSDSVRFRDWDLLPFLFRGIEVNAPWVNHVYLVTDGQVPDFLDTTCEKLTVVDHKEFIPEKYLPVFSSQPIELNLFRIPGLQEEYVFFNDDMFLVNPCLPEDYFKNGVPCDEGSLNGINGKDEIFAGMQFQNISLMNRHYSNGNVKKHIGKWLYPGYGKNLLRTLLLLPFSRLQGIYNHHGPMPILKTTCKRVWKRDGKLLDETCHHRFRSPFDITGYVFRYEQLLSGRFVPAKSINRYLDVAMPLKTIEKAMEKEKSICINDAAMSEDAFIKRKAELHRLFERKFPNKSIFEK